MARILMNLDSQEILDFPEDGAVVDVNDGILESAAQVMNESTLDPPSSISFFSPDQNRYGLQQNLGRGGYAMVSLAKDVDIGRFVALKVYLKEGDKSKEHCQKELKILGALDHTGIPTIYDFGQNDKGQYYCSMRYIQGETLKEIIRKLRNDDRETHRRYKFQERADVIIQLLRVVKAAHSKGIIHRDIKPDNIMLTADGTLFLIDWGIAKSLDSQAKDKYLIGTPPYMSPEQASNKLLNEQSDIYSIAAVFYEFLCLERAIPPSNDPFKTLSSVRNSNIPLVDKLPHESQGYVPSEFKAIVHKGLEKELNRRYLDTEAMLFDLVAMRNGEFCAVCPRTTIKGHLHGFMRWLDRNPYYNIPITGILLFGLPLILFLGGWWMSALWNK